MYPIIPGIAVDRYVAIEKPLHYNQIMTEKAMVVAIVIIWTYPLFLALLPVFGWNIWKPGVYCLVTHVLPVGYTNGVLSSHVLGILLIIVVLYGFIFRSALQQRHKIQDIILPVAMESDDQVKKKIKLREERKTAKTLGIVIGLFSLSMIPYCISSILIYMFPSPADDTGVLRTIQSVTEMIGFFGSAANPVIYATRLSSFRNAFQSLGIKLPCFEK